MPTIDPLAPYRDLLCQLEAANLCRHPTEHPRPSPDPGSDFTSNDYLALSTHPALRKAAADAALAHGTSAASSYLVTGRTPQAAALEKSLASGDPQSRAVLFPSGYQANLGLLVALDTPETRIFSDALNHASLIDGSRLCRAPVTVYPHKDLDALHRALHQTPTGKPCLIVTDALFSMHGDLAPIAHLAQLAYDHHALLLVDEAHSFGVLGPQGQGLCAEEGVVPHALVVTFSKALGSHGACVRAQPPLLSLLHSRARALIYSTALPPPVIASTQAAIDLLPTSEIAARRAHLLSLADSLIKQLRHHGYSPTGDRTPIVSLSFPDSFQAPRLADRLRHCGLLVWAFRPPTVPAGTSLLRISLRADHQPHDLARLLAELLPLLPPPTRRAHSANPQGPSKSTQHPQQKPATPSLPDKLASATKRPVCSTRAHTLAIVGTDTAVGKTVVACGLLTLLRKAGLRTRAFKPVETGLPHGSPTNTTTAPPDHERLDRAAAQPLGTALGQGFPLPAAPAVAARAAARPIDLCALDARLGRLQQEADIVLIEGAGGLLVPFTDTLLWLDVLARWATPVLLVARLGLGTLNHTLLTHRELTRAGLRVLAVILNAVDPPGPEASHTPSVLAEHLPCPVLPPLPHGHTAPTCVASHLETAGLSLYLAPPLPPGASITSQHKTD